MSYAEKLHRQCPECKEYALPAGKIICCQNCLSIINTETNENIGNFAGEVEAYYENKLAPVNKGGIKMEPDEILMKASELYEEKGKEYGDNWKIVGLILSELLKGVGDKDNTQWYWDRVHLVTMIVVKLTRFTVGLKNQKHHEDSTKDLVVYAAMLDSLSEK